MSKYLMNKLIHHVNMNESAEDEYVSNPRGFVEKWEKGQKLRKFTPEEREALSDQELRQAAAPAPIRSRSGASPKRFGSTRSREKS